MEHVIFRYYGVSTVFDFNVEGARVYNILISSTGKMSVMNASMVFYVSEINPPGSKSSLFSYMMVPKITAQDVIDGINLRQKPFIINLQGFKIKKHLYISVSNSHNNSAYNVLVSYKRD